MKYRIGIGNQRKREERKGQERKKGKRKKKKVELE